MFVNRASSETNDFDLEPMLVVVLNLAMFTPAPNRFHCGHLKTFVLWRGCFDQEREYVRATFKTDMKL